VHHVEKAELVRRESTRIREERVEKVVKNSPAWHSALVIFYVIYFM
jgi:hypothetical protein